MKIPTIATQTLTRVKMSCRDHLFRVWLGVGGSESCIMSPWRGGGAEKAPIGVEQRMKAATRKPVMLLSVQ
jgi:hypothetical protein